MDLVNLKNNYMKYTLLIACTFIFSRCYRLPLNVYSPAPANSVIVKNDGDAGINASYYSNGPKHLIEKDLASNGFAVQGKAVVKNKWFIEGTISSIKEASNGQFENSLPLPNLTTYKVKTTYNYKEIGVGKILNLNSKGSNNLLLSAGYGYTKYKSNFNLASNTINENANFSFNNNHLFLNTQFQFEFGILQYQIGLKNNLINFKDVNTNNPTYFGKEQNTLQNEINGFKISSQLYNDIGIFPFKDNKWLSIHAGISLFNRIYLEDRFRSRNFGGSLSIMANPSGILKKKK
jgi:hypothetical protein